GLMRRPPPNHRGNATQPPEDSTSPVRVRPLEVARDGALRRLEVGDGRLAEGESAAVDEVEDEGAAGAVGSPYGHPHHLGHRDLAPMTQDDPGADLDDASAAI